MRLERCPGDGLLNFGSCEEMLTEHTLLALVLAEALNSLYKCELIYRQDPGRASTKSSSPPAPGAC
jgi:hypothetical protein